jgi:hypothetical protein
LFVGGRIMKKAPVLFALVLATPFAVAAAAGREDVREELYQAFLDSTPGSPAEQEILRRLIPATKDIGDARQLRKICRIRESCELAATRRLLVVAQQ